MSMENVKNFMQKVQEDQNLVQQLKELTNSSTEEGLQALIELAKGQGYPFDKKDLEAFFSETAKNVQPEGELNEAELDAVAGGDQDFWLFVSTSTVGFGCIVSLAQRQSGKDGCLMDNNKITPDK